MNSKLKEHLVNISLHKCQSFLFLSELALGFESCQCFLNMGVTLKNVLISDLCFNVKNGPFE